MITEVKFRSGIRSIIRAVVTKAKPSDEKLEELGHTETARNIHSEIAQNTWPVKKIDRVREGVLLELWTGDLVRVYHPYYQFETEKDG